MTHLSHTAQVSPPDGATPTSDLTFAQQLAVFTARLTAEDHPAIRLEFANFLWASGQADAARRQFERVLQHPASLDVPRVRAVALNQLACLHRQRGEYAEAAVMQRRSLALDIADSFEGECGIDLGNLAADAIAAGDLDLAENLLRRSLACEIADQSLAGQAADCGNLALVYGLRGENQPAIRWLRKALRLHRHVADARGIADDLTNLASLYESSRRRGRAWRLLHLAIAVAADAGADDIVERAESMLATLATTSLPVGFDPARN